MTKREHLEATILSLFIPNRIVSEKVILSLNGAFTEQGPVEIIEDKIYSMPLIKSTLNSLVERNLVKKKVIVKSNKKYEADAIILKESDRTYQSMRRGYVVYLLTEAGFNYLVANYSDYSSFINNISEFVSKPLSFSSVCRSDNYNRDRKLSNVELILRFGGCATRCTERVMCEANCAADDCEAAPSAGENSIELVIKRAIRSQANIPRSDASQYLLQSPLFYTKAEIFANEAQNASKESTIGILVTKETYYALCHTNWPSGTGWVKSFKKPFMQAGYTFIKTNISSNIPQSMSAIMFVSNAGELANLILSAHCKEPSTVRKHFRVGDRSCNRNLIAPPFTDLLCVPVNEDGPVQVRFLTLSKKEREVFSRNHFISCFQNCEAEIAQQLFGTEKQGQIKAIFTAEDFKASNGSINIAEDDEKNRVLFNSVFDAGIVWEDGTITPVFFGYNMSIQKMSRLYYILNEFSQKIISRIEEKNNIIISCQKHQIKYYKRLFPDVIYFE